MPIAIIILCIGVLVVLVCFCIVMCVVYWMAWYLCVGCVVGMVSWVIIVLRSCVLVSCCMIVFFVYSVCLRVRLGFLLGLLVPRGIAGFVLLRVVILSRRGV